MRSAPFGQYRKAADRQQAFTGVLLFRLLFLTAESVVSCEPLESCSKHARSPSQLACQQERAAAAAGLALSGVVSVALPSVASTWSSRTRPLPAVTEARRHRVCRTQMHTQTHAPGFFLLVVRSTFVAVVCCVFGVLGGLPRLERGAGMSGTSSVPCSVLTSCAGGCELWSMGLSC